MIALFRMVPNWVWLALISAAISAFVIITSYNKGVTSGKNEVQQAWGAAIAIGKDELLRREREARAMEQRHSADMARIGTEHQERMKDAQAESDRIAAGLRAGTIQLQDRWRGCVAAGSLSGPIAAPGFPDAADASRQSSASRIIAAADQCDSVVKGLQDVVRADRAIAP